jgi:hypothetical protein
MRKTISTRRRKSSRSRRRARRFAPKTAEQFFASSDRSQDAWTRTTNAISKMRADGVSLQQASREVGIDPRTVIRRGKSALRKLATGRYAAKANDRLLRVLKLPTTEGLIEVAVRNSREASRIAKYSNGVQKYLRTGNPSELQKFSGMHITDADGTQIPLLTDLEELNRLGSFGLFSFESLYARTA